MKRGILGLIPILLLKSASAYSTEFSLNNILDSFDPSTIILGGIFLIAFALIYTVLSKKLKNHKGEPNTPIAAVIAGIISFFIIYGLNKTNLRFDNIAYDLGLTNEFIYTLAPIVILIILGLMIWKLKRATLLALGAIFLAIPFTGLVYNGGALLVLGIILVATYFLSFLIFKKKAK